MLHNARVKKYAIRGQGKGVILSRKNQIKLEHIMNPMFSIIMTSYNYEAYISAAIESVIAQTFSDWELIIVDDCSSDNSWDVISKYKDPRIITVRFEANQGAYFAYHKGVELSKGRYLASLDSDDMFAPNKLYAQWRIFQENQDVGVCGTWVKEIDFSGAELSGGNSAIESWFNQSIDLNNPQSWLWQNRLCNSSTAICRLLHERLGSSRPNLRYTPDWDMWIRAFLLGARFHVIEEPLTFSRQHNNNITHQNPARTIDEYADITAISLNPYLINLARFDLIERNLRGFWEHPALDLLDKEKVLSKAIGFRDSDTGLGSIFSEKLITSVVIGLLEQCKTLRGQHDSALSERDAERDAARTERDAARTERDAILCSLSWRITKPIRTLALWSRMLIRLARFLLVNKSSLFTWKRLKKGVVLLKNGDISRLKTEFTNTIKGSYKHYRRARICEPILSYPLSQGQPLVSVIIPCFNYGDFVASAIDSVLSQTLKNVEIIVIDGGSTDTTTIEILKAITRPRTTILFREGRHLVGDNRNFGIAKAKGRYICCLDADDTLNATYLEKAVFQLETYGYDIVSTAINFVGAKEGQLDIAEFPDLSDMVNGNHVLTCAVFRKQLWESSGGYVDVGLGKNHVAEDWDYWLRLTAKGARIRNIAGEALFNYRVHLGGSLSSASDVKPLQKQKEAILARNRELLTPEAFRMSAVLQSKNLRCNPSETALALNFNADATSKNKTLLLAIPFSMVGGAERLLSGLCLYLANNGWKVIVVTTLDHDKSFGSSIEWFKESTSEVYELPRFLQPEERRDFIHYLISSRKPDCLINAGSRLIYEQLPLISGTYPSLCVVDLLFNTVGHVKSHMEFKKFCNFALAENQEVYDWYIDVAGWQSSQIRKLSSGVDLDSLKPTSRSEILAKKYGITHDELVIGFSGRLSKEKAPDIFVEIAKLCHGVPNLRFIMTGAGPMAETISMKVKSLPKAVKFEFAGLVDDVNQYLALYDLLVLPSRFDGRPLVVMEALACGVPVIASSVGALSDLIDSGENGYLLPAANAEAFAEKVRYLAKNRKFLEQMKANARQVAEERLGASVAYRGYDAALTDAIDKHRELNVFVK